MVKVGLVKMHNHVDCIRIYTNADTHDMTASMKTHHIRYISMTKGKTNTRTSNTTNARIGERSIVPPSGGIIPRNRLRYGSQIVAKGVTIA